MNKTLLLATMLGATGLIGSAAAQQADPRRPYTDEGPGFYVSGGYTFLDIETDNDVDALDDIGESTNALTARFGYQVSPVFSLEAEGTFGIDDGGFDIGDDDFDELADNFGRDDDNLDTVLESGGDLGLDYLVGGFVRAGFPVNERLHLGGRVGYAFADISSNVRTVFNDDETGERTTVNRSFGGSDDGFAFGATGRFDLTDNSAIRADYTRYNFGEANADAVTVSYVFRFGGPGVGY